MNWLDWIMITIVALSAWRGLRSGLIAGVARLLGLVLGVTAAFAGHKQLAAYLDRQWNWGGSIADFLTERLPGEILQNALDGVALKNLPERATGGYIPEQLAAGLSMDPLRQLAFSLLELLAFIMVAIAVYMLVTIVLNIISGAAANSFLSPLDRLGGLLLGLARGALVIIIAAAILDPLNYYSAAAEGEKLGFLGRAVSGSVIMPYIQVVPETLKINFPGLPDFTGPTKYI
ncbi:MAG: CvpA family protein [Firmicutes bacterium]|nr:CvpA family protein [Bacillota bacterium]